MSKAYQSYKQSEISLSYLGRLDDEVTGQLIAIAESYTQTNLQLEKISKRVSFLIAESFQNVVRHGKTGKAKKSRKTDRDFFQITYHSDRILITSKNSIATEEIDALDQKIAQVNSASKEELKDLWSEQLTQGKISNRGGAGLGIIEMARKSGMKLQRKFRPVDDERAQFFLGLEVIRPKQEVDSIYNLDEIVAQYDMCEKDGVLLQYKGNFSEESTGQLISLLHNNFVDEYEVESTQIEMITIIIEVLQNASKHGASMNDKNDGMFSVVEKDGERHVVCGNYLCKASRQKFESLLTQIKGADRVTLENMRRKILKANLLNDAGNGSLGMLEIALYSNNNFEYSFNETDSELDFFSIELKLSKDE